MRIPVTRAHKDRYEDVVYKNGKEAQYVEVPGILPDGKETNALKFKGIYVDHRRQEILVKWPVDRPPGAQEAFAKEHCFGAFPAEYFDRVKRESGLSAVRDVSETNH
jgi:hypothetical protein